MTVRSEKSSGTHLNIRLDEKLKQELARVAKLHDRSLSGQARQLIRDALRDYSQNDEEAA